MTEDGLYWFFTSSSQTVAAFVAFLLAGFVFVASLLDDIAASDETLSDVHAALKAEHFRRFRELSFLTAFAVCCDLLVVLLQATRVPYHRPYLLAVSVLATFSSVIAAVLVTIRVIDPKRYQTAARSILKEQTPTPAGPVASAGDFLQVFIDIERLLRDATNEPVLVADYQPVPSFLPFTRMLDRLLKRGLLTEQLYGHLRELAAYRNLVVHGHVLEVSRDQLTRAEALRGAVQRALSNAQDEEA